MTQACRASIFTVICLSLFLTSCTAGTSLPHNTADQENPLQHVNEGSYAASDSAAQSSPASLPTPVILVTHSPTLAVPAAGIETPQTARSAPIRSGNVSTLTQRACWFHTGKPIDQIVFSPNSRLIAVATRNSRIEIRRVTDGSLLATMLPTTEAGHHPGSPLAGMGFSMKGLVFSAIFEHHPNLYFWQTFTGNTLASVEIPEETTGLAVSPSCELLGFSFSHDDCKLLSRYGPTICNKLHKILILDFSSGETLATIDTSESVSELAFSMDTQRIAAGIAGSVYVFDTTSGEALIKGYVSREPASGSSDERETPWTLMPGPTQSTLNTDLRWGYQPEILVIGYDSGEAVIWDVDAAKEILSVQHCEACGTVSVALSPDHKLLATGAADGIIRIWSAEGGQLLEKIVEGSPVLALDFSPDSWLLASGSYSGLTLWGVP